MNTDMEARRQLLLKNAKLATAAPVKAPALVTPMPAPVAPPPAEPKPEKKARADFKRPKAPSPAGTINVRDFTMPNGGRRLMVDRRIVSGLIELDPAKFKDRKVTLLLWKPIGMESVPVLGDYDDVRAWWRGEAAAPAEPAKPEGTG
jgi:hypothetical protein